MNEAFGRYRLLERLGQGGMAEVFKAKSYGVEGFEKILVIKRILPDLAKSHDFVDMFIHEAKLAVRLSHANVVQVFDLGRAAGSDGSGQDAYYIAMEYVHGFDLASVLARARRRQTQVPIQMAVYVASEIAKGLDHAHRRRDERMRPLRIVHRDVSPQNVLLSFEGEVKVTDFGIAKARGALDRAGGEDTRSRALHGKFGYMSPEQARGEEVDARSDLFSLGTILYECVAGVNPFTAPTTFETLRRVQAGECPPIELFRPEIPPDLVAILKTAMATLAAERYPDAGRMYEALLAFLYSQGSRFGALDLSEFLSKFRDSGDAGGLASMPAPLLDAEAAPPPTRRNPLEVPTRRSWAVSGTAGSEPPAIERAAELGERREVTGVVVELPRQTPAPVTDRVAGIVERWGGRVLRRDDGHIAAIFGLGDPDGRDTEMATRCALVALRSLDASDAPGAGLHTGRIHVSRTGEPTQDEQLGALLDKARNLARARPGQASISLQALRSVRTLFEFDPPTESGTSGVETLGALVRDVLRPAEAFGRFVGRKDELRRIGEALAAAARRTPRVITIRGDHGVGKSRLLYEVGRRLRKGGYNVGFHLAACTPRGADFPLSGIGSMLQVLCGTSESDTNDRILAVEPRLRALGLRTDEAHAVLAILGATVPAAGGNAKARLRQAFARTVQSLCEDRPYVFAWDVAHAMDEESFGILEDVLRRLRSARFVFAFGARAGFTHPLEGVGGHVAIDLGDLAPPDVERLAALRLGVGVVPEELVRFVRGRAGGHPLFVEEVIKGLVDAGAVTVAERCVVSMKLTGQDLALPKTLRGLVASRVARLSIADRAVLQAAAVLGDPVDLGVLSGMLGQPMRALERSAATLKERAFVVDRGPSEVCFTSPLIPEIVVDALTAEAARQLHAAAGQALETSLGLRAWEHAAVIAHHLYEAGDRERAAGYFAKSGERHLEIRQLEAAARDFARAIALADSSTRSAEQLVAWLGGLASAVRLVRACPDALELCTGVIDRTDKGGSRELRIRVRVEAGRVLAAVQRFEESRRCLSEAEVIAGADEQSMKPVLIAEAELATRQGDFKLAGELLERLQQVLRTLIDDQERHRLAIHLAQANAGLGHRAMALANLREAEAVLPDDKVALAERTRVRATVDHLTRDFRSAAVYAERAIDLAREMGLTYEVTLDLHKLGDALLHLDDRPRAYGALRQSLALCEEFGYERLANDNRMLLVFLDGLRDGSDAVKLLEQGIAYAASRDFKAEVIGGHWLLATLLQHRGQLEDAREEFETARSLASRAGHRGVAEDCERALLHISGRLSAPPPARESTS
ncbi:MAG TPA: protein kinase [Polyangiaceae bacterium]|nr:protein kinase [Polyangiaceae bacterium]